MAKKSMVEREAKRKKLYEKYKNKREKLRSETKQSRSFDEHLNLQHKFQKLPRNSSKCRLKNRCWVTGRSRGFYRHFGLSRHVFREMSHECLLPGIKKSSW